jgi:hypothetical protein
MNDEKTNYEPLPAPFPVGIEVQYVGPDEPALYEGSERLHQLDHGSVGLVVAHVPGLRGRPAGTYGPDDPGFEVVHGRSEVAYLRTGTTMVAARAGQYDIRAADHFRNLEPDGVADEVVTERLAGWKAEHQRLRAIVELDKEREAEP